MWPFHTSLQRRILTVVERMEISLSAASDYLTTALDGLDTQLSSLQTRVAADAKALQDAIDALAATGADTAALQAAALRVKTTADLVASLDQPSVVVDPQQPDVVADPIPPTPDVPAAPDVPPPV